MKAIPLPLACREFLREALAMDALSDQLAHHAQACASCGARWAARNQVRAKLRELPPAPALLRSRELLDRVHESIVQQSEAAPLGELLAGELTLAKSRPAQGAVEFPLQESALAARVTELSAASVSLPGPGNLAWQRMQNDLVGRIRAEAARRRYWPLGATLTVAAAAALLVLLTREPGLQRTNGPAIEIAFADLSAPPAVEFTVLRHGIPR